MESCNLRSHMYIIAREHDDREFFFFLIPRKFVRVMTAPNSLFILHKQLGKIIS